VSLPETASELAALAKALGANPASDLLLRGQATEAQVRRRLAGAPYRTLAFATHALVAGEIHGLAEPALVVTPPPGEASGEADDGLLTAGEIASALRLDSDWVILSACNTAAPDGTPGAQGLSGLAKAFFYAGSRALLVSHWAVYSNAAVKLTTARSRRWRSTPRSVARRRTGARCSRSWTTPPSPPSLTRPSGRPSSSWEREVPTAPLRTLCSTETKQRALEEGWGPAGSGDGLQILQIPNS
jgi:hypothetical protein